MLMSRNSVQTDWVLSNIPSDYKLILVGDAQMAPHELLGGYYGGCMMVLFTAVGYLAVRAFAPQKLLNGLTFCAGITTALVTVLYVLNIFNIDLIGTYANTAVVERAQFFSTLGQKNFCSGFMAFALPLVLCFVLLEQRRYLPAAVLYGVALAIKPQALLFGPVLALSLIHISEPTRH